MKTNSWTMAGQANDISSSPNWYFRYLEQDFQAFHRKYVLAPADIATNNVGVVWWLHYINILLQVVPKHMNGFLLTWDLLFIPILSILLQSLQLGIKENQDNFQKRPYKARFIANACSRMTTILSKLLTSCLTVIKKHWIRYSDA